MLAVSQGVRKARVFERRGVRLAERQRRSRAERRKSAWRRRKCGASQAGGGVSTPGCMPVWTIYQPERGLRAAGGENREQPERQTVARCGVSAEQGERQSENQRHQPAPERSRNIGQNRVLNWRQRHAGAPGIARFAGTGAKRWVQSAAVQRRDEAGDRAARPGWRNRRRWCAHGRRRRPCRRPWRPGAAASCRPPVAPLHRVAPRKLMQQQHAGGEQQHRVHLMRDAEHRAFWRPAR